MPKSIQMILPDDLRGTSEGRYQKIIEEMGAYYGYEFIYHTGISIKSKRGFPDLAMYDPNDGGCAYFEVKNDTLAFTKEQKRWLDGLRRSGFHAYGVRPEHAQLVNDVLRGEYLPPEIRTGRVHPDLRCICPPTDPEWT